MNLNQDQLDLITDLCNYAENVTKPGEVPPPQIKQLRKFVAQNTWYGPYNNPFKAYLKCANANNIDTSEVMQFVIPGWLSEWEMPGNDGSLLDDLLQELGGYTHVIIEYRLGEGQEGWYARLDKEVE